MRASTTLSVLLAAACTGLVFVPAPAQERRAAATAAADPAVWGVYAGLLDTKIGNPGKGSYYSWHWDEGGTGIVQDRGELLGSNRIVPLGDGKLGLFFGNRQLWTGTRQPDGAVVWEGVGNFLSRPASGPYRVRLEGDELVFEHVQLKNGEVVDAWPMQRIAGVTAGRPPVPVDAAPTVAATPAASPAPAPASAPATAPALPSAPIPAEAPPSRPVVAAPKPRQPRQLSEEEIAKLRASVQKSKVRNAQEVEQARRALEESARQTAEEIRMLEQAEAERQAREDEIGAEQEAERQRLIARSDREKAQRERALEDSIQRLNDSTARIQAQQAEYRAREQAAQSLPAAERQRELENAREATRRQYEQAERFAEQQRAAAEQARQQSRPSGLVIEPAARPDDAPPASSPAAPARDADTQQSNDDVVMAFHGSTCALARASAQRWVGSGGTYDVADEEIVSGGQCRVRISNVHHGGAASAQ